MLRFNDTNRFLSTLRSIEFFANKLANLILVFSVSAMLTVAFAESNQVQLTLPEQSPRPFVSLTIPELTLTNQDAEQVNIISDLISNKLVLLNTIFTSCSTICSPVSANLVRLQKVLAEQLGEDRLRSEIVLLSISVDPANDTPQRLKAWQQKFNGKPGWSLLTGSQADIDKLLKRAGLFSADYIDHTPIALLGSVKNNQWLRVSGLTAPKTLANLMIKLLHDKRYKSDEITNP